MKTLIIHHLQPMWENGYKNLNTSFYEQLENVYNHIIDNDYDNLIITNFEAGFNLEDEQNCLKQFVYELQDYIYGWELNEQGFTDDEIERIEDGEIVASESGVKPSGKDIQKSQILMNIS